MAPYKLHHNFGLVYWWKICPVTETCIQTQTNHPELSHKMSKHQPKVCLLIVRALDTNWVIDCYIHTELAVISFRDSPNAYPFQGRKESVSARPWEALERQEEEDGEEKEERLGEDIPCEDQRWLSMSDDPEEQDRECQRHSDNSCESVCPQVMGRDSGRSSSVVFYEGCSILVFCQQGWPPFIL